MFGTVVGKMYVCCCVELDGSRPIGSENKRVGLIMDISQPL